jgi:hypothetical protein
MRKIFLLLFVLNLTSCRSQTASKIVNVNGNTIKERFKTPDGFIREDDLSGTYDNFFRDFALKSAGTKVYTYNGSIKYPDNVYDAVLDIDVGEKDLQQCADAVMRLRAEYLYANKLYEKIHFNFTNGKKAEYVKYAEGYRFSLKNNSWVKTAAKDYSYKSFRAYMDLVFNYAGSLSLSRELKAVDVKDIKVGDVFIKGGSPGHAVTVVDVAINPKTKEKIFMIAQSYMPAQNIHVLKNFGSPDQSPWYSINFGQYLKTPEWTFEKEQLMRFEQ